MRQKLAIAFVMHSTADTRVASDAEENDNGVMQREYGR